MAQMFLIPIWLIYTILGFFLLLVCFAGYIYMLFIRHKKKDTLIFIDKTNRWSVYYDNLMHRDKYMKGKGTYILKADSGKLNSKGKALYIFSENNPLPLKIDYNRPKWLDAESLMATINNELIKLMVNPTNSTKDLIIMLGAIGGLVAGFASIIILLLQTGVING